MIHLKATCDKRREKKDGSHSIVFRITVNGKSRDISTGLSCHTNEWDFNKNTVKDKSEDLKLLSKRVKDMELRLLNKIREYEQEYPTFQVVQAVKDYLCNKKEKEVSVKEFWLDEVNRQHRSNKHSNAFHLESILMCIEKLTSLSIPFQLINYAWLTELETKLRENGLNTNSVSVYLRALRSIYNKAINHDLIDYSQYPFRRYKIKNGTSSPRTLTIAEMRSFFHYTPTSDKLKFANDMGKLIFMLRGINFTDLALLTCDNVNKDRIIYQRSKTDKRYSVKILSEVQVLLDT